MRRLVLLVALLVPAAVWAQTTGTTTAPVTTAPATTTTPATTTPAASAAPAAVAVDPVPYTDKEFPGWVLKVRRAEILTIGAFPIAYLFAGLIYDYTYYISSGFPSQYAPWPAGPGTSQWTTTTEPALLQQKNLTLVGMSVAAGLMLAFADWLLGL
jgi:hypothetical protein